MFERLQGAVGGMELGGRRDRGRGRCLRCKLNPRTDGFLRATLLYGRRMMSCWEE